MKDASIRGRVVDDAKPAQDRCRTPGCMRRMTFAEQGIQWGRALRFGMSKEEVTAIMPLCQKCMTELLSPPHPR